MTQTIQKKLQPTPTDGGKAPQPVFFQLASQDDQDDLTELLKDAPHTRIIDTFTTQLKELFVLKHPPLNMNPPALAQEFATYQKEYFKEQQPFEAGNWVYLPWRHTILHLLADDDFQKVRTGRNRNLITPEEQVKYYNSTIGVAGQSVGNSCALAIVQTGGGKHMKLADLDTLELTNLNRIRGSIAELTEPKVFMTARQIYELDPYADLTLYTDGVTEENLADFCDGLDVIVDEIDNLEMKIRLRQQAKQNKTPLVMATDNGDSGVLDIERYDQDQNIIPFHGRGGEDIAQRVVGQNLPLPAIGQIIGGEILGYDIAEERTVKSLLDIGQSIPTWPQLGTAATLNGAVIAVAVRRIVTGQPLIDNRANISLPALLEPDFNDPGVTKKRQQTIQEYGDKFNQVVAQLLQNKPH